MHQETVRIQPCYTACLNMKTLLQRLPYRTTLMALLGLIVGVSLLGGLYAWQTFRRVSVSTPLPSAPSEAAQPTPDPFAAYNILLLGYGGGGHEGGKLTDTIMVARVDPRNEVITLISLPRDLWVSFPVEGETESHWKLNAAYQIGSSDASYPNKPERFTGSAGGGALAKYAVGKVLGEPIRSFVAVSFAGFTRSIGVLNGVNVHVEHSFDDYWYPIEGEENNTCGRSDEDIAQLTATLSGRLLEESFPCRYEHLHFDAGTQLMDGETALKFVRSRHSAEEGSDFSRAARQRSLLLAVKEKVVNIRFLPRLVPFMNSLTTDMQTDIGLNQIQEWIAQQETLSGYEIRTLALTDQNILKSSRSQNGQFILIPKDGEDNWLAVQSWLAEQLSQNSSATSAAQQRQ